MEGRDMGEAEGDMREATGEGRVNKCNDLPQDPTSSHRRQWALPEAKSRENIAYSNYIILMLKKWTCYIE